MIFSHSESKNVIIDGWVNTLHYEWTAVFLGTFSFVGPIYGLFGKVNACDPIDGVPIGSIKQRCEAYLGIEMHVQKQENAVYSYDDYLMITLLLLFQAMLFYVPRFFWETWEGGLMEKITSGLIHPILNEKYKGKKIRSLAKYMKKHVGKQNRYFTMYMITKILYLVNVLLQTCFVHLFLGGNIFGYGFDFVERRWEKSITENQMTRIFPSTTNCSFISSISPGISEMQETQCYWLVNVFNERFYFFLCYWFYILSVITIFSLVGGIICISCKSIHTRVLSSKRYPFRAAVINDFIQSKGGIGDYFVFRQLAVNIDGRTYRELMNKLFYYVSRLELEEATMDPDAKHDRDNVA